MTSLYQIQEQVRARSEDIAATHGDWPCRKGCDDCCRHLASAPRITRDEWLRILNAIDALPSGTADLVRHRIRESAGQSRPVVCPLLDTGAGVCLVYDARPVACRAYGFYAERSQVLGCTRIEAVGDQSPEIVWGNHLALEERLSVMGPAAELSEWLARIAIP